MVSGGNTFGGAGGMDMGQGAGAQGNTPAMRALKLKGLPFTVSE